MVNILVATSAPIATESACSITPLDIVWFILIFFYFIYFGVFAIAVAKDDIKNEEKWSKKPIPATIQLIAKGMIGLITVGFVIYALINWSSCTGTEWLGFCCLAPVFGIILAFGPTIVFMFGYYFLYKPFAALISYLKKKE